MSYVYSMSKLNGNYALHFGSAGPHSDNYYAHCIQVGYIYRLDFSKNRYQSAFSSFNIAVSWLQLPGKCRDIFNYTMI